MASPFRLSSWSLDPSIEWCSFSRAEEDRLGLFSRWEAPAVHSGLSKQKITAVLLLKNAETCRHSPPKRRFLIGGGLCCRRQALVEPYPVSGRRSARGAQHGER